MISILIPVFNFDVRPLVADLVQQCNASGRPYEILCFDDGSDARFKEKNKTLNKGVVEYCEMPRNLGRSAIRNRLGQAARFPYLLFMDCDSKVVRPDYIQQYLDHLAPNLVLYGGRTYMPRPPADPRYLFHWKYGSAREQMPVRQRQKHPWHSFMTNNFLLPKEVFLNNLFDESLTTYGHEDTLFGLRLSRQPLSIVHLDNPLQHLGLETATVFLKKTKQGLTNLHYLWEKGTPIDTKLLRYFTKIKKAGLVPTGACFFDIMKNYFEKNLCSHNPRLRVFDLYKLGYLCFLDRKK